MRRTLHKLVKDESGVTMGLAVIMVVVIMVMGAGLLTFVMRDLDTVVEANRGQIASEMADAGMEAAKRQLARVDARASQYDGDATNDESDWSDDGSPKPLNFDGNQIEVAILYLRPSLTSAEASQPDKAPEVLPTGATDGTDDDTDPDYPNNRHYFRVTVEGSAGQALRRFQAIYKSENFDLPIGYYATRDIRITGSAAKVNGLSLFAERYITNFEPEKNSKCGTVCGKDQAYGNWAFYPDATLNPDDGKPNPYNSVRRSTDNAGAAALGGIPSDTCSTSSKSGIEYSSENDKQKLFTADPQHYGLRDFDRDSDYVCGGGSPVVSGRPGFSRNTWGDPANQLALSPPQITFPFAASDDTADATMLDALKAKAQDQGHYLSVPPGTVDVEIDRTTGPKTPPEAVYPGSSTLDTVMFIEFSGTTKGKVIYKARTENGDGYGRGTIVVVNGDLELLSGADDFEGIMIIRDRVSPGRVTVESEIPRFENSGSLDVDGYVNVEGDLFMQGSVGGILPGELLNGVPGLVSVSTWSWRECYNTTCT